MISKLFETWASFQNWWILIKYIYTIRIRNIFPCKRNKFWFQKLWFAKSDHHWQPPAIHFSNLPLSICSFTAPWLPRWSSFPAARCTFFPSFSFSSPLARERVHFSHQFVVVGGGSLFLSLLLLATVRPALLLLLYDHPRARTQIR